MKKNRSLPNIVRALALTIIAFGYPAQALAENGSWVCGDCSIAAYDCDYVVYDQYQACNSYAVGCDLVCWWCISGNNGCA